MRDPRKRGKRGNRKNEAKAKRKRNGGEQAFPFLSSGDAPCEGEAPRKRVDETRVRLPFSRGATETALTSHLARRYLNARGLRGRLRSPTPRPAVTAKSCASPGGKLVNLYGV